MQVKVHEIVEFNILQVRACSAFETHEMIPSLLEPDFSHVQAVFDPFHDARINITFAIDVACSLDNKALKWFKILLFGNYLDIINYA